MPVSQLKDIPACYLRILHYGLVAIREAASVGDYAWVSAESEHLHELPAIIHEPRVEIHRDYLRRFRGEFLAWVRSEQSTDRLWYVEDIYQPAWERLAALVGYDLSSEGA